jgi:cytochrome c6
MIPNLTLRRRAFSRTGISGTGISGTSISRTGISGTSISQTSIARTAIARGANGLAAIVAGALCCGAAAAADVHRGATLYATHCAMCHGSSGAPVMPNAPNLRRFDTLLRPDMQLLATIRRGKGAMPGYLGLLKDREILDVIAHLRTLSQ